MVYTFWSVLAVIQGSGLLTMDMAICRMKQGQGSDAQHTVPHISLELVNRLFTFI